MNTLTVLGLIAACCTTLSFVPQVWQIMKTRQTTGISLPMYIIFTTGVLMWVIYGYMIKDFAVFIANVVTLLLATAVLGLTLWDRLR
ncbi:MAG: SemiSWEET transporter [Reinekea sp.]|nr:SemiSWEET transporter [Reinekea sp.]